MMLVGRAAKYKFEVKWANIVHEGRRESDESCDD
jgi:hypothetical protein